MMWPQVEVKTITSPPKGRVRKNVHNLFTNNDNKSPAHKRAKKGKITIREQDRNRGQEQEDTNNAMKVQAFIQMIKAKKRTYTQQKINFGAEASK